jgi:ADP-heptose:LPS heptosyltransferase
MPRAKYCGYLILKRSMSWAGEIPGGHRYQVVRGQIFGVHNEHEYNWLLRTNYFRDPHKQFRVWPADHLKKLRDGTEVVIVRDIGMGDLIIISAAVEALTKKYPKLRFSWATNSNHRALFDNVPWLSTTYQISSMRGAFDVIDLRAFAERHHAKYQVDRIDLYFDYLLGKRPKEYRYSVPALTDAEREWARETLAAVPAPRILVTARSSTTHLRSFPEEQVKELSHRLVEENMSTVLTYNTFIQDWPASLNLTGQLDMRRLAAISAECDCVISPDTGMVHLAEAVETPHVDLYSSWPPRLRLSHYRYAFPIWKSGRELGLAKCPCFDKRPKCTTLECMKAITSSEVIARVREALEMKGETIAREEEATWATP